MRAATAGTARGAGGVRGAGRFAQPAPWHVRVVEESERNAAGGGAGLTAKEIGKAAAAGGGPKYGPDAVARMRRSRYLRVEAVGEMEGEGRSGPKRKLYRVNWSNSKRAEEGR